MKYVYTFLVLLLSVPMLGFGQLSGTKQVPSVNYPGLQAVVDSLNSQGVGSSGVSFIIAGSQVFNEPFLTLTASGTENGPVEIKWDESGDKPIVNFTGTAAAGEAGISLSGSDYITINGLDIRNPDGLLEYGVLISNADELNGAHHNAIKNCVITLNKTNVNQTEAVRVFATTVPTNASGTVSFNSFINNTIQNSAFGYNFDGNTYTTPLMSVGNEVGAEPGGESLISDIVLCGVYIKNQNGFTLHHTTVENLTQTSSFTPAAVSTTSGNPTEPLTNTFEIHHNTIKDITSSATSIYALYMSARKSTHNIYNNVINNITATGGGNNSADGILVFGTDIIANVYNNMVSGIAAPASVITNNAATRGINVRTFGAANIYYNTVLLQFTATNSAHTSAAMCVYNANSPVDMRNNIFVNLTTLAENPTGYAAALYKSTPAVDNIAATTNNNIYYAGEPSANHPIFFGYNSTTPAIDQTLAEYKLRAGSFDQASFTENVTFISASDLHIQPLATTVARNNGLVIASPFVIDTDIDGNPRDAETPDIGADEIANGFPDVAQNPEPIDGAADISIEVQNVTWDYISSVQYLDPVAFLVYKNTSPDFQGIEPFAVVPFESGTIGYQALFNEGVDLEYSTTYYWKVVPTLDVANGPEAQDVQVWSFTTQPLVIPYPNTAENPVPENGTIDVDVETGSLGWSFSLLPSYTAPAGFKVYLGTTAELTENDMIGWVAYDDQLVSFSASLDAVSLEYETEYFWKVVPSVDQQSGPDAQDVIVWSFTTAVQTFPYPNPVENMLPAEGDTLIVYGVKSYYLDFSFDFTPNPVYTVPTGFKVYAWGSDGTPSEEYLYVEYVEGQTEYIVYQGDNEEIFDNLAWDSYNKWKVVPTTDPESGYDTPDVEVVEFYCKFISGINESQGSEFKVYPNPSSGIVYFTQPLESVATIEVVDLTGKVHCAVQFFPTETSINLSSLEDGLYFIRIKTEKALRTGKLFIKK